MYDAFEENNIELKYLSSPFIECLEEKNLSQVSNEAPLSEETKSNSCKEGGSPVQTKSIRKERKNKQITEK